MALPQGSPFVSYAWDLTELQISIGVGLGGGAAVLVGETETAVWALSLDDLLKLLAESPGSTIETTPFPAQQTE